METTSKLDNARFIQPLLSNFLNSFSIPKAFQKRYEELKTGNNLLDRVVLTTEDRANRYWGVEIEGGRHFKEGWKEFSEQNGLQVGDFVIFAHQIQNIFLVSVYDPFTACQRILSSSLRLNSIPNTNNIGSKKERKGSKFNSSDGIRGKRRSWKAQVQAKPSVEDQHLRCRITLTSFAFKTASIYLPKKFVRLNGLQNRCCEIKLIDGEGKTWKILLNYRRYDSQAYIRKGWKQVQTANGFRPRDRICFQILESGRWPTMKCYRLSSGSKS